MQRFTQAVSILLLTLLISSQANADHLSSKFLFAARMNGAQEVPAVTTNALGLATFYLNHTRDTMCLEMTATGLSGAITGIHIHDGVAGTNGPVLVNLTPHVTGTRVKATITGADLTDTLIWKMFNSELYLNLHTAMNANGEIRGQILPEEDKGMVVGINGAQEVPAVTTTARGTGSFMLQKHNGKLSFNIVVNGLSGPITGIHLHRAAAGANGPVVEDLGSFVSGNQIMGSVDPTAYLNALMNDSIYLNVHTSANPAGEIRGQLMVEPYLHFDAMMDTAQETTPVTGGAAIGQAGMKLNYSFDTLWYDVQVNGLTGPITAAHFHKGEAGTSGGVLIGIPNGNIVGNRISGMITGSMLADTFISDMLSGAVYLNVHTSANPNGEVRGQVYRTFREGYTYHLNGAQEAPQVSTMTSGTGMVSIDRDQTSAHFMMVIDSLMGFSMAHFHNNVSGENGAVIYNLTPFHNNGGIFGYWTENDPNTAFTKAMSNKFRKDSVYVNVHTSANPNGEVRGDVTRNLCNMIPQSISKLGNVTVDATLYPNPAYQQATLDITVSENTATQVSLYDMMGRKVWTKEQNLSTGVNRVNIPVSNLTSGIYSLQIRNEGGQTSMKLIKE